MTVMRFLVDEDTAPYLAHPLRKKSPLLDVICVGEAGAPPKGTPDPDLLLFAEAERRTLISGDHNTMPRHEANHLAAGHHTWGVWLLRPGFSLMDYVDSILVGWGASEAEEWRDIIEWIPL
jgi:hypothetical protein